MFCKICGQAIPQNTHWCPQCDVIRPGEYNTQQEGSEFKLLPNEYILQDLCMQTNHTWMDMTKRVCVTNRRIVICRFSTATRLLTGSWQNLSALMFKQKTIWKNWPFCNIDYVEIKKQLLARSLFFHIGQETIKINGDIDKLIGVLEAHTNIIIQR